MKKILLTVLLLILSLCYGINASADTDISVEVMSDLPVYYGDTIGVIVKWNNNQSLSMGNFDIKYDNSILKLKGYTIGDILKRHNPNVVDDYSNGIIKMVFWGFSELQEGNMLELEFEVMSDKTKTTDIAISNLDMVNDEGEEIEVSVSDAGLVINKHNYTVIGGYLSDCYGNSIDEIPSSGSFCIGLNFNKNFCINSKDSFIYAVFDEYNKLITVNVENNEYSLNDGLNCETEITLPDKCGNPAYVKCFIWSIEDIQPLSNICLIKNNRL